MHVLMWEHFAPGGPIRVGGHHFARRFAAAGDRVVWCTGPLAPWNLLGGNAEIRARRALWRSSGRTTGEGVFAYAPLTFLPHRRRPLLDSAAIQRRTLRATWPDVRSVLAAAGFETIDLLFMEPGAPLLALLDAYPRARAVYRMCDDTAAFDDTPRSFAAIEAETMSRVDLVVATAKRLAARAADRGARRVLYLPNACEPERFASPGVRPDARIAALPGPRAIYAGGIEAWFDRELLAELARRMPHWSFVLVGPLRGGAGALAGVRNVHLAGPRPYEELPSCLAAADAALLPFRPSAMTHAIHPIKVYEYLAAGLPVISAPLEETRAMGAPIRFAADAAEFAAALRDVEAAAAPGDAADRAQRRAFARRHSWDERFATLRDALASPDVPDGVDSASRCGESVAAGLRAAEGAR
jgi:glycosyltransferase involved in cell wall biosynthesis